MSVIEAANRGHGRGKSLDLNKMIQADMTSDGVCVCVCARAHAHVCVRACVHMQVGVLDHIIIATRIIVCFIVSF